MSDNEWSFVISMFSGATLGVLVGNLIYYWVLTKLEQKDDK